MSPNNKMEAAKNMINIMNFTYFPQSLWVSYVQE